LKDSLPFLRNLKVHLPEVVTVELSLKSLVDLDISCPKMTKFSGNLKKLRRIDFQLADLTPGSYHLYAPNIENAALHINDKLLSKPSKCV